jgi:hypothetical protein
VFRESSALGASAIRVDLALSAVFAADGNEPDESTGREVGRPGCLMLHFPGTEQRRQIDAFCDDRPPAVA